MQAAARKWRSPMAKNSASSPPGAGTVAYERVGPVPALEDQHLGVAVAHVHAGRRARDVERQLRDREQLAAADPERLDRARPGRRDALQLGEGRGHALTQPAV